MQAELDKLIDELETLSLTSEQSKRLHQYQAKLEELEAFLMKHIDDGESDCMLQATKAFMHFRKKIVHNPLADFDYLKGNIAHLGWKNESLQRSNHELLETLMSAEQLHQKNTDVIVYALLGIAGVDYQHGNHESSIATLNKVNNMFAPFNYEHPNYFQINTHANMHNSYGLVYRAIGKYDKALIHFKKSLSILKYYKKDSNLDGPKLALMNNIVALFTKQKQWKAGLHHFETYNDFVQKQLKGDKTHNYVKVQLSTLLITISMCYMHLNQYALAEEKLILAEQLIKKIEDIYQYLKTNLLYGKSTLSRISGNYKAAIKFAQQSFQYVFPNFHSLKIEDNPNIREVDFAKMQKLIIEPFAAKSAALVACFQHHNKDEQLLKICLKTIDEIAYYFDEIRKTYDGQESKFSLAYYSKNLYHTGQLACWYLYKATSKIDYAEKAFAYANSSKALVLLEEMHKKWLSESDVNYSIEQIQSIIKANETIIEYSVGEKGIFIYRLSKNDAIYFDFVSAENTKQLKQSVDHWLKHHFNIYQPNQYNNYQKAAYNISEKLILPYIKSIETETTLIIAPDGFLNALPFEALVKESNTIQTYNEINYLIDHYTFAYTFSTYLLYVNRQTVHTTSSDQFLYLSPNFLGTKTLQEYEHIQQEQQALLKEVSLTEMNSGTQSLIQYDAKKIDLSLLDEEQPILISKHALYNLMHKNFQQTAAPLLYNALMVSKLSTLLSKHFINITLLENQAAQTKTYKKQCLRADYILISAHAESDKGILLYDETGENFTYLSYHEVISQNLQAQLVVLNMCDSGKGKNVFGEGYLSLGRAFFAAGSLNVIQTLYKVSDKYSAQLIASFFAFLTTQQSDFYTALRQAKLLLRKAEDSHPKFWAGHVVYGKNGRL